MEYLGNLVNNYSITVPFALRKLGEQNLAETELEEIENFVLLYRFRRDTEDITDRWEFTDDFFHYGSSDYPVVWIFTDRTYQFHGHPTFHSNHGVKMTPKLKQFMVENKHLIRKVFLWVQNCERYLTRIYENCDSDYDDWDVLINKVRCLILNHSF